MPFINQKTEKRNNFLSTKSLRSNIRKNTLFRVSFLLFSYFLKFLSDQKISTHTKVFFDFFKYVKMNENIAFTTNYSNVCSYGSVTYGRDDIAR